MEKEFNARIPEGMAGIKARTVSEMEEWAVVLHDMGYQCRLEIGNREIMTIRRHGYEYHLVEGDPDRRNHGIPLPCFMGYEGFALRSITRMR